MIKELKCKLGIHMYGPLKQLVVNGVAILGYRCGACGKIKEGK